MLSAITTSARATTTRMWPTTTRRCFARLPSEEIEEKFVKGTGRGGQKINKVRNCVQLTHLPTGISVHVQDTRSLESNRGIARKRLEQKVEFARSPQESKIGKKVAKLQKKKQKARARAKKKYGEKSGENSLS